MKTKTWTDRVRIVQVFVALAAIAAVLATLGQGAQAATPVVAVAKTLTKGANADGTVPAGGTVEWTVKVSCSVADCPITITDNLAGIADVTDVVASAVVGLDPAYQAARAAAKSTDNFSYTATFSPGSYAFVIVANAPAWTVKNGAPFTNTVIVKDSGTGNTLAQATAPATINAGSNWTVKKTGSASKGNREVHYGFDVCNAVPAGSGPQQLAGGVLVDNLPVGATIVTNGDIVKKWTVTTRPDGGLTVTYALPNPLRSAACTAAPSLVVNYPLSDAFPDGMSPTNAVTMTGTTPDVSVSTSSSVTTPPSPPTRPRALRRWRPATPAGLRASGPSTGRPRRARASPPPMRARTSSSPSASPSPTRRTHPGRPAR